MKIYTKTGDKGETSLFNGQRVSKAEPRVNAYGTLDELSSVLGLAAASGANDMLKEKISALQQMLFRVCADLATPAQSDPAKEAKISRINPEDIHFLENEIDHLTEILPPMRAFILAGGTMSASFLHLARTVCRRAERIICSPDLLPNVNPQLVVFVNRLSDLLFLMARYANFLSNNPETEWIPSK